MSNDKAAAHIEHHKTFPTGPTRLLVLWTSFKFEIKTGMRMSAKVPKCTTILRKEFGITGKPQDQLFKYEQLLLKHGIITLEGPAAS